MTAAPALPGPAGPSAASGPALPLALVLPRLPPALGYAVGRVDAWSPGELLELRKRALGDLAREHLATWERLAAPLTRAQLGAWLALVNKGASNPLGAGDFAKRLDAVLVACDGLPAAALTRASAADMMRATGFSPGAGEVWKVLSVHAADVLRTVRGLRVLAEPVCEDAREPTGATMAEAERDAVLDRFRRMRAEAPPPPREDAPLPRVPPAPVSAAHLDLLRANPVVRAARAEREGK